MYGSHSVNLSHILPASFRFDGTRRARAIRLACCFGLASTGAMASAADLVPGNLVVERIGNGTTALSGSSAAVAVQEFTTSGTLVQTLTTQFTGSELLTDSGSATSNGYLNSYGGYLAVPGLNVAAGTTGAASLNVKATNVLGVDGNVANRVEFPTGGPTGTPPSPFSGSNFRSAIATSANTFYATGTSAGSPLTGGTWYYNGTDFVQVSGTQNNLRNIEIYGGQLYVSSGANNFQGISSVGTGLPTTTGTTTSLTIATGTGSSPYGFVIFDTNGDGSADRAYIADDRNTAGGGIQRWDLNSSSVWVNSYALLFNTSNETLTTTTGTGIIGIRGLTGSWDATSGTASLFATTTETNNNRLVSLIDSGSAPTTFTTLSRAGANFVYRGVDFTPVTVPEPSTYVLAAMATGILAWAGKKRRKS
ncbi:PEP-CTERM sorting domain-containing protein [bacterium]|nr:PEP-CTERM sorting domain-containing protein [bacterium]